MVVFATYRKEDYVAEETAMIGGTENLIQNITANHNFILFSNNQGLASLIII